MMKVEDCLFPTSRGTTSSNSKEVVVHFKELDLISKVAILGSLPLDLVQKLESGQKPISLEDEEYLNYYKKYNFLKSCLVNNIPKEFKEKAYLRFSSLFFSKNDKSVLSLFKEYLDYGDFLVHDLYNQANMGVKYI